MGARKGVTNLVLLYDNIAIKLAVLLGLSLLRRSFIISIASSIALEIYDNPGLLKT